MSQEVDQLRVQLAGCGVAALGGTTTEQVASPGDYGWSPSYQDTLNLRRRFDKLFRAMSDDKNLSENLQTVLQEVRKDMGFPDWL